MHNKLLLIITAGLFTLNFTTAFAQILEIEVIGGGYRVEGPCVLPFGSVEASFSAQENVLEITDPAVSAYDCDLGAGTLTNPDYIRVTDESAGNAFDVQISLGAGGFWSESGLNDTLASSIALYVQNNNSWSSVNPAYTGDNNTSNDKVVIQGSDTFDIGVIGTIDTENFVQLSTTPLTLGQGSGNAPGQWEFYPVFIVDLPAALPPDTYKATINITVI